MKIFFVYIMTNPWHTVLYTGVTAYLDYRGPQHKFKLVEGFTKQYNATKMVYAHYYPNAKEAIAEEKRIKGITRKKKVWLINQVNPGWKDLLDEQGEVDLTILRGAGGMEILREVRPATVPKTRAQDDGLSGNFSFKHKK